MKSEVHLLMRQIRALPDDDRAELYQALLDSIDDGTVEPIATNSNNRVVYISDMIKYDRQDFERARQWIAKHCPAHNSYDASSYVLSRIREPDNKAISFIVDDAALSDLYNTQFVWSSFPPSRHFHVIKNEDL